MKTTIPAPFETPASAPSCPYEALRLGLGLRARDAARLTSLVVATALLAMACGGVAVEPTPSSDPAPSDSSAPTAPAPAPVCKSSNTAPGCPAATSASWAVTCDITTPAPAVWCTAPEGDTSGKVWCC